MKIIASTIALIILIVTANACVAGGSATPVATQPDVPPTAAVLAPIATLTTPVSTATTAPPTPTQAATIPVNTPYSTSPASTAVTPTQASITSPIAAADTGAPLTPTPQTTTTSSGFVLVAEPTATPAPTSTPRPAPTATPVPTYYSSQFTDKDYAELAKQLPSRPELPADTLPRQTGDQTPEGLKTSPAYQFASRQMKGRPFGQIVRPTIDEHYGKRANILKPHLQATQYELLHPNLPVFRYVWEGSVQTDDEYEWWRFSAYFILEDAPPVPEYPDQKHYTVKPLDGQIHGGIIQPCQSLLYADRQFDC